MHLYHCCLHTEKKGRDEYQRIGLIKVIWEVIEIIIDRRLATSIEFHDILHGFRAKQGTRTDILEVKLILHISGM